jgi:hypothetical protein
MKKVPSLIEYAEANCSECPMGVLEYFDEMYIERGLDIEFVPKKFRTLDGWHLKDFHKAVGEAFEPCCGKQWLYGSKAPAPGLPQTIGRAAQYRFKDLKAVFSKRHEEFFKEKSPAVRASINLVPNVVEIRAIENK